MPKLKTKSSAKKRFRFTASGKIKMPQAGKRHGMIKRTNSQIRKQRAQLKKDLDLPPQAKSKCLKQVKDTV